MTHDERGDTEMSNFNGQTTRHGFSNSEPGISNIDHLRSLYDEEAITLGGHIQNFIESNTDLTIPDELATDIGLQILEAQS